MAIARSRSLSSSRSAATIEVGRLPVASGLEGGTKKFPAPLFLRIVTLSSNSLATATSRSASPSRSAEREREREVADRLGAERGLGEVAGRRRCGGSRHCHRRCWTTTRSDVTVDVDVPRPRAPAGRRPRSPDSRLARVKSPALLFFRIVTVPSFEFATARSWSMSPSTSAATTVAGPSPVASGLVARAAKLVDAASAPAANVQAKTRIAIAVVSTERRGSPAMTNPILTRWKPATRPFLSTSAAGPASARPRS